MCFIADILDSVAYTDATVMGYLNFQMYFKSVGCRPMLQCVQFSHSADCRIVDTTINRTRKNVL